MNNCIKKILIGTLIIPCACVFVACGQKEDGSSRFTANESVAESTQTIINNLTTNYYNATELGSSKSFTVEELKDKNNEFNYYVEVGQVENIENVDKISIGESSFDEEDTFKLSIGNNNFISDKAFFKEDNKLFVAAPIIAFETVNNNKIKINNNEYNFDLEKSAQHKQFSKVEFSSGTTNVATKKDDNNYELTLKDAKTYLKLFYPNAVANDIVLTRKVVTGSDNASLNGVVNYGLTKVESETGNPLGLYPIGYSSSALTDNFVTNYNDTIFRYDVYVAGNGVFGVTFNIKVEI